MRLPQEGHLGGRGPSALRKTDDVDAGRGGARYAERHEMAALAQHVHGIEPAPPHVEELDPRGLRGRERHGEGEGLSNGVSGDGSYPQGEERSLDLHLTIQMIRSLEGR